ncbi:unnamed protein product [Prorocentrum cordatum]|uniref:Uncharacterized protein n=1 Tax=Prorocentrum cordatum TaxID=2364126 RepID=A0ABN9UML1_9DINO|nr:unnamed protein product [Polarella glacialis]
MLLRFEVRGSAPSLQDWVPMEVLQEVHRRCQSAMNEAAFGGARVDGALGALRFSRNGVAFLHAECTELMPLSAAADPSDSEELELMIDINMHGLSKLRMPWQSGRSRGASSLQPIDELPTEQCADDSAERAEQCCE